MDIAVLFGTFILLVVLTVPIGYAIGMATLVTLVFFSNTPLVLITQNAITGVDSFPLMAIPFFMLAGNLMSSGGVARRIVNFCDTLLGWITGGLGIVTTLACMIFAAISGSAVATTSAIGGFMIPEMTKRGYDKAFSASLAGAAGTIGVIIPPSIPFVIYAVVVGESISDLFIAGVLPGILMGIALMVVCVIVSKKEGYQKASKMPSLKDVWHSFTDAFWALLTPVIILGGIYSGIFTPTESAVVAVVYSFIVGVFVYREYEIRDVIKVLRKTCKGTSTVLWIMCCAGLFSWVLTYSKIPDKVVASLAPVAETMGSWVVMLLVIVIVLIMGCFMGTSPIILIVVPLFQSLFVKLGYDMVHWGTVISIACCVGMITPPFGNVLFTTMAVTDTKLHELAGAAARYIVAMVVGLLLIAYIPALIMWAV